MFSPLWSTLTCQLRRSSLEFFSERVQAFNLQLQNRDDAWLSYGSEDLRCFHLWPPARHCTALQYTAQLGTAHLTADFGILPFLTKNTWTIDLSGGLDEAGCQVEGSTSRLGSS